MTTIDFFYFSTILFDFFRFVDDFFWICRQNFWDLSTKILGFVDNFFGFVDEIFWICRKNMSMTLSNDCIVTWVTRPERPKGAKDEVKEA